MSDIGAPTGVTTMAPLAGDSGVFEADPVAYIKGHACMLHPELQDDAGAAHGSATNQTYNRASTAVPTGVKFEQFASARLCAKLYAASNASFMLPLIKVMRGNSGREFAFLPWKTDGCTATVLFSSADMFLTGPLTGCNVYIGEKDGFWPIVLHANSNKNADDRVANTAAKDTDAINIATKLGYLLKYRLARGSYQIPAFVWGTRSGSDWSFFVHEANVADRTATNKALSPL